MRAALNQPYREKIRGLGQGTEEFVPGVTDMAIPPATTAQPPAGIFSTIVGGLSDFLKQATSPTSVQMVLNRTMYGKSIVPTTSMYQGVPVALQPKAGIPTEWLYLGGGLLAVVLLTKKRKR